MRSGTATVMGGTTFIEAYDRLRGQARHPYGREYGVVARCGPSPEGIHRRRPVGFVPGGIPVWDGWLQLAGGSPEILFARRLR